MKRFERSNGLDTALYKNYLYLFFPFLASLTLCGFTPIIFIKECMTDNKVKLNDVKTEIMFIFLGRMSTSLSTQDYFAPCNTPVPLYDTFNHLFVTLDCHLYFNSNYVVNHVRTANFERRRISSIRHLLTTAATATLVSDIIISCHEYCTLSCLSAHNP